MADANTIHGRKVLVFVPGIGRDRSGQMRKLLEEQYGQEWDISVFRHGIRRWSLGGKLKRAVDALAVRIAFLAGDTTGDGDNIEEVRLVGHSVGGLLVRAAYLRGLGIDGEQAATSGSGWASKVRRIVLIGTPNAGFRPSSLPLPELLAYFFLTPFWDFVAESIKEGGYWITNLRLRWMEALRSMEHPPLVVQVLGGYDKLVPANDNFHGDYMPNTGWTSMDGADHKGLVDLSDPAQASGRWKVLKEAIFGVSIRPIPPKTASEIPVYFIVHGVRASAYEDWVQNLKSELKPDQNASDPHVVAINYDFLSAYEFALPFSRHKQTQAFLIAYGNACREFKPDNFSFAGHSNGTYLLGRAMKAVPAVRFRHVFLAGTVLPTKFNWLALFAGKQIGWSRPDGDWQAGKVHNDRASVDVPVGILCAFLRGLWPFNQDIGTGGFRGFNEEGLPTQVSDHARAFPPGHGSALLDHPGYPPRMPQIASFLKDGSVEVEPLDSRSTRFSTFSRAAQLLAWPVVLGVGVVLYILFIALMGSIGLALTVVIYAAVLATVYVLLRII